MNKRALRKQKLKQVFLLVFLALIVLGFTVPGFIYNNEPESTYVASEPRLCQSDSDCYLDCEEGPVAALCSQNLCLQNSCDEESLYLLHSASNTFSLKLIVAGEEISFNDRINPQDFFITFAEDEVNLAAGLALRHILDKIRINYDGECLSFDDSQYCSGIDKELKLTVNGEQSFAAQNFIPQNGDVVVLEYS